MLVAVRWMAWLLLLAIALVTVSPIGFRPVTGLPADLERTLAFALVGGAFCLGYPQRRLAILLLVVGAAGVLEAAQNFVPSRHAHMHDAVVKALGAVGGLLAAMLLERVLGLTRSRSGLSDAVECAAKAGG
jgi:dihydrodipicolinate synthase/N-acetylneuraminate lyase